MQFQVNKLSNNTFDVFAGTQWDEWSRLRGGRNGVYVSAGRSLPYAVVRELAASIDPSEDKQLVVLTN